jgi:hypothetical protein
VMENFCAHVLVGHTSIASATMGRRIMVLFIKGNKCMREYSNDTRTRERFNRDSKFV